jgi:hypothetical protein
MRGARSFICLASAAICATAFAFGAKAQCVGGATLSGGYSILIRGNLIPHGTEALAGRLSADGQCNLAGTFYGEVNAIVFSSVAATGTYSYSGGQVGTMSIEIGKKTERTFSFYLATGGTQIIGFETDGSAEAELDGRAQGTRPFSNATFKGPREYTCAGTQHLQLGYDQNVYDGAGRSTGSQWFYESEGTVDTGPLPSTYAINADGTYTEIFYDGGSIGVGNKWSYGGAIDSNGAGSVEAFMSVTPGTGVPSQDKLPYSCRGQAQ